MGRMSSMAKKYENRYVTVTSQSITFDDIPLQTIQGRVGVRFDKINGEVFFYKGLDGYYHIEKKQIKNPVLAREVLRWVGHSPITSLVTIRVEGQEVEAIRLRDRAMWAPVMHLPEEVG